MKLKLDGQEFEEWMRQRELFTQTKAQKQSSDFLWSLAIYFLVYITLLLAVLTALAANLLGRGGQ